MCRPTAKTLDGTRNDLQHSTTPHPSFFFTINPNKGDGLTELEWLKTFDSEKVLVWMDRRRRCFTLMEEQEDTPPLGQSYCHTVYISMQILFSSTWDAVAMTEWHLSLGNIIIIKAEDHQEEQSLGKVDFHSVVAPFSGGLIYKPRSQMITQLSKKVPQMQSHREECLSTWTCPSKQQLLMPITASLLSWDFKLVLSSPTPSGMMAAEWQASFQLIQYDFWRVDLEGCCSLSIMHNN